MTDDQFKKLAAIVLTDYERIDLLTHTVTNLIERMASAGDDFDGRANKLRFAAEQLEALAVSAAKERDDLRKFFGIS